MLAITGASGFLGSYCVKHLQLLGLAYTPINLRMPLPHILSDEVTAVMHLAGKAHDLKKVAGPDEYFKVNTELTKQLFEVFLRSKASLFIYVSSVKAIADAVQGKALLESDAPQPLTPYGKSKRAAEQYLQGQTLPEGKQLYILRPCMIHGPGNKGNLNLLYKLVKKGIPWPLGVFENKRSFLSVDNFCFVIDEILAGNLPPDVYNLADSEPLATNEVIHIIAKGMGKGATIWSIPKSWVNIFSKIGDIFQLPLNTERLQKLTENYVVSNQKLVEALGKPLPVEAHLGMMKTIRSFEKS